MQLFCIVKSGNLSSGNWKHLHLGSKQPTTILRGSSFRQSIVALHLVQTTASLSSPNNSVSVDDDDEFYSLLGARGDS